jgi:hypothetical protein
MKIRLFVSGHQEELKRFINSIDKRDPIIYMPLYRKTGKLTTEVNGSQVGLAYVTRESAKESLNIPLCLPITAKRELLVKKKISAAVDLLDE